MSQDPRPDSAESLLELRFSLLDGNSAFVQRLYALAEERIDQLQSLREKTPKRVSAEAPLKGADMAELLKNLKLPPLPQILIELQRVMNDPDSSASDLAEVISKDPKLTATLLRVVNSALYSFPSQIETVSRAVAVVGMKQLSTLATGMLLLSNMNSGQDGPFSLEMFWKHSIACGTFCRKIAQHCRLENPERYFVAGLLHDIGLMTLAGAHPEQSARAFLLSGRKNLPLHQAESQSLGFDHAKFGAYLIRKWDFPPLLVAAVAFHHAPEKGRKYQEPKVLHVADFIANGLGYALCADVPISMLDPSALQDLGLKPDDLDELVSDSENELNTAFEILMAAGN